jgi:Arc/MetJ-type ribon-helix-helix transcriptional regulator
MPGVDLSNVVLPDDLQQALISRVESGQFASQGALIEEALRSFLIEKPAQEAPERDRATEPQPRRLPSPFILDEWAFGPGDIPRRPGREVDCVFLRGEKRRPDRYPGE